MIKLKQIVQKTDMGRKSRAEQIPPGRIETVKKMPGDLPGNYNMEWYFIIPSQSIPGKTYRVIIRTSTKEFINKENWKLIPTSNVSLLINCSCDDFKYRWETVLWKRNAARRMVSDGNMPDITNPEHKISLCKHCLVAINILNNYVKTRDFDSIKSTTKAISDKNIDYTDRIKMLMAQRAQKNKK